MSEASSSYPDHIWDGDSPSRNSNSGNSRSPSYLDWNRCISEVAATQRFLDQVTGFRIDPIEAVGEVANYPGLLVAEHGTSAMHKTNFLLYNFVLPTTDGDPALTNGAYGAQLIYTLPIGLIKFFGSSLSFAVGNISVQTGGGGGLSDTADFEIAIGALPANNEVGFGMGVQVLEEKFVDGEQVTLVGGSNPTNTFGVKITDTTKDGTVDPASIYLNVRMLDDASHGPLPDALILSGTIRMAWCNLGGLE